MKTLTQCVEDIRKEYLNEDKDNPVHLYRGEPGFYEETRSQFDRILLNRLNELEHDELWRIIAVLCLRLEVTVLGKPVYDNPAAALQMLMRQRPAATPEEQARLEMMTLHEQIEISCYMQHYGIATCLLDFNSSLDVAAHFASTNAEGRWRGRIGIVKIDGLKAFGIQDIRMSKALRPREQHAFALPFKHGENLKDKKYGVEWRDFSLDPAERSTYQKP